MRLHLIATIDTLLSLVEDVLHQLVLVRRYFCWDVLVVVDKEVLQSTDDKTHVLGVASHYLFDLVPHLLEEGVDLPKINSFNTHLALRNTIH